MGSPSGGGTSLTRAVRLEGTVEFQQDHGGRLQIHRGYLGLGAITSIAYPDRISDTCQNLSGMTSNR
jgi:hypothetical protein